MSPANWWAMIAAFAAVAAAGIAAYQIFLSRRDANRRAALSYLERLDDRVRPLWSIDIAAVQEAILRRYRGEGDDLSPQALDYLSFLNTLDLLAFATSHDMVAPALADRHVATLFRAKIVSASFLREMQRCCGDLEIYEDLFAYVVKHRELRQQSEASVPDNRQLVDRSQMRRIEHQPKPQPAHTPKPEIPPPPQRPPQPLPQPPRPEPPRPTPKPGPLGPRPGEKGFPPPPRPKKP